MARKVFNPVKEEIGGKKARSVIWSTESINIAIKALEQGKRLIANPFYENNTRILKADLTFERTNEEIEEWKKCRKDIIYFVEKYCKLKTPEGIKHVKLRDYQEQYLKHLTNNQLSICLQCRQSGKSTTTSLFMIHFLLFNLDKNALICSNKFKSAKEVVSKAKNIYENIPYFLKPGVSKWNEAEVVMDNGCRMQAETTTEKSGIGDTIDFLLLDEFAHVAPNKLDTFYNNIFPVITAAKAKLAIISTQNGRNLFYRLYTAAVQGINEYKPFKVEWQDVPEWNPDTRSWEKRDEVWHQKQIANYGSEEAFESQMGTKFDLEANTLVSQKYIASLSLEKFENKLLEGVSLYDYWFWKPSYDIGSLKKDYIVITCDLAEGLSQDYTVFSLYRLTTPGTQDLECIGYFRSNNQSRENCVRSLLEFINLKLNALHTILSYERNTYGELFRKDLIDTAEKYFPEWGQDMIVKYYNESRTRYNYGVLITRANKTAMCVLFKEDYESGKIINRDELFNFELENFGNDGHDNFKATFGHDDTVMAAIQLEFVKQTISFANLCDDFEINYSTSDDDYVNFYESGSIYDLMDVRSGEILNMEQSSQLLTMGSYYGI